jgi:low temperature requirement protein LtrA
MTDSDATVHDDADGGAVRVSTIELFFDLIFVFAITQLTTVLVEHPNLTGAVRVLLMFGAIWWMYGAYVWLTNSVPPTGAARRLLLLVAMAGFLLIALAVPTTFEPDGDGLVFGIGYLLVTVIHAGMFTRSGNRGSVAGIVRIAPFNLASAVLILVAGTTTGTVEIVLWALAVLLQVITPMLSDVSTFRVQPDHFVERHSLIVLIVLGESVVALGGGARHHELDAAVLTASLLGLALTACLWWVYFGGDDERATAALVHAPVERRPQLALNAFFYSQIPMLLGVVAVAAGVEAVIDRTTHDLPRGDAWLLAGGAAAYFVGDLCFRRSLRLGDVRLRFLVAVVVLATGGVGIAASGLLQLTVMVVLVATALTFEWLRDPPMDSSVPPTGTSLA